MRVERGMLVETDFGRLRVVCVTREWLIACDEKKDGMPEYAIAHKDEWIGMPLECETTLPTEDFVIQYDT